MRYRHLFWDFDGTLYDSYPQIIRAMDSTLQCFSLPVPSDADLLREAKVMVSHALEVYSQGTPLEQLMPKFNEYHRAIERFPLYAGVKQCLENLHSAGGKHYLYTHRNQTALRHLEQDGLTDLFTDFITSEDGFPLKPAPDALLHLINRHGLFPADCAMIGDRAIDIESGHNAGMAGILFDPEGFYPDCPAEKRVSTMEELCRWVLEEA